MIKKLCIVFGLSLLVVACGGQPNKPTPVTKAPETSAPKTDVIVEQEVVPEASQSSTQAEESKTALKVIEVDDNPDQFLGANLSMVNQKIGTPVFARRDGEIEVWQYRRDWNEGTCHLDLFLYPVSTASGTDIRVKFTDLRSQFLTVEDQRACFAEMLRDHIRHSNPPTS